MHNVSIHRCSAYLGAYSLSVQNQTHFIVDIMNRLYHLNRIFKNLTPCIAWD